MAMQRVQHIVLTEKKLKADMYITHWIKLSPKQMRRTEIATMEVLHPKSTIARKSTSWLTPFGFPNRNILAIMNAEPNIDSTLDASEIEFSNKS